MSEWILGHMPLSQRAKIFTPFAALKGFEQLIARQEEHYEQMPELSDDQYEELDRMMKKLSPGDSICVKYYRDGHIGQTEGPVSKIDKEKRIICIGSLTIGFDEMIRIDKC